MNTPFPFLIGGDPEFNIIVGNEKVGARMLLTNLKHPTHLPEGDISHDHHEDTGEFNPKPAFTPRELTTNLDALIKTLSGLFPIAKLNTNSQDGWVGGHIHLDLPHKLIMTGCPRPEMNQISRTLNFFWTLPLLGENPINIQVRRNNGSDGNGNRGYGRMDTYQDRYMEDGRTTYEFRLPSAEWLTYPKLAEATLAYVAAVWHEIINRKGLTKFKPIVFKNLEQMENVSNAILSRYDPIVKTTLSTIKNAINKFEFYKPYKKQIDYLFDFKTILAEKEKINYDLTQGWTNPKLWYKMPQPKDTVIAPNTEICEHFIPIYWNEDYKMDKVKSQLSQYIIQNKTEINNPICIYGLKKEVKTYLVTTRNGVLAGEKLITTTANRDRIIRITDRMRNRCNNDNIVAIGIPYEDRQNNTYLNPIIELITNLNKSKLKLIKWNSLNLPNLSNKQSLTSPNYTYEEVPRSPFKIMIDRGRMST